MRYPYIAFTFAHVWRALLLFAHHFVLYIVVMVITLHVPGWPVLLAVPALALIAANGIWLSLLFGMASLRWRDLIPATTTAMQIMMFVTPVFWSKEMLGPELAFAADFNPLYHFVRIAREPLLGTVPPLTSWIWVAGTLVCGMTLTLWVYGRFRDRMAYWY
jgi:ABC-type polysaccharide/polyol phosphate export permease